MFLPSSRLGSLPSFLLSFLPSFLPFVVLGLKLQHARQVRYHINHASRLPFSMEISKWHEKKGMEALEIFNY
jgi:hypothetical protein